MPLTAQETEALRGQCTHIVPGYRESDPGEELIRVGEWCREHGPRADRYGEGPLLEAFEAKVAAAAIPGQAMAEFNVGDNLLDLPDAFVLPLYERLLAYARPPAA
jgi:hypothetical protein